MLNKKNAVMMSETWKWFKQNKKFIPWQPILKKIQSDSKDYTTKPEKRKKCNKMAERW